MVLRLKGLFASLGAAVVAAALGGGPIIAQAPSQSRSIAFYNIHTKETLSVVYKRNGRYVPEAMDQIDWMMRDWRKNQKIKMDPELIDLLWEIHTELGSHEPIHLICGHRTEEIVDGAGHLALCPNTLIEAIELRQRRQVAVEQQMGDLVERAVLHEAVDVRICTGEKGWHAAHYRGLIDSAAVDVIMVDPGKAEGVTGAWGIITMAAAAGRAWTCGRGSGAPPCPRRTCAVTSRSPCPRGLYLQTVVSSRCCSASACSKRPCTRSATS